MMQINGSASLIELYQPDNVPSFVRYWHLADMLSALTNVRYRG